MVYGDVGTVILLAGSSGNMIAENFMRSVDASASTLIEWYGNGGRPIEVIRPDRAREREAERVKLGRELYPSAAGSYEDI